MGELVLLLGDHVYCGYLFCHPQNVMVDGEGLCHLVCLTVSIDYNDLHLLESYEMKCLQASF